MLISRREFIVVGAAGAVSAGTAACTGSCGGSAAETRLSVVMSGLIAMVPSGTATELLLVDGDATLGQAHAPRLLAPPTAAAAGSIPASGTDGPRSFWDLKNHRVTLASGTANGTTRVTGLRGSEEKPLNSASHRDVGWIAKMSRIPAAAGRQINPQCLAADPRPAKVASRVRFNEGEFAARFTRDFAGVVWQIGDTGSPNLRQALAELTLSHTIPGDQVVFRLEPFDAGPPKEIVLARSPGVNLEIEIANLPAMPMGCKNDADANNLAHFAAYYQLLADPPPPSERPIPRCTVDCAGCGHQGETILCPPIDVGP